MITPYCVRSLSCSIKKLVISSRSLKVCHPRKSYNCYNTPSSNASFRWFVTSTANRYPMASEKPKVVFVLGGPGAGKGTQCQKIVEKFGFVHLSAGDLLREERARPGSQYGEEIEMHIRNGTIVPVKVTCSLLENAMNKNMKELGKNKFLVDGFPRNQDNLDGWNEQMSDKTEVCFVLFFNCPEEVCTQRCLSRGQSGSGRSDDNAESLKKRIVTYNNDSLPIIEHFKKINLVREIDAGMSPDEVFARVEEVINECAATGAGSQ